jgi:hypothetical protein
MNTNKLKSFAQAARRILMEGVSRRITYYGFDAKGRVLEEPIAVAGGVIIREEIIDDTTIPGKWEALRSAIQRHGIESVTEEAAYTWFNRLMAMQILAKNNYDAPQLDYESFVSATPVILARARRGMTAYLDRTAQRRIQPLLGDYQNEQKAFAILLTGYCHHHQLLNRIFGRLDDYTELLLPDNILAANGLVHLLNTSDAITNDDYRQVELIGWLYQFYISEKKDQVFANFKKNKKAEAEDIPAATQIFTPNWIVKYMVQNTVGRIWLDHHPESPLRQKMKYLVSPPQSPPEGGSLHEHDLYNNFVDSTIHLPPLGGNEGGLLGLSLLDPACGSGHILVEGFFQLYDIYEEEYYMPAEAVEKILQHNLFGLDIDLRAAQLARFAVLLAAATKYPDILKKEMTPHIYAMPEPAGFDREEILDFLGPEGVAYEKVLSHALELMQQAKNLGSVMQFNVQPIEREFFMRQLQILETEALTSLMAQSLLNKIAPFLQVFFILTDKYEAIAANPPYMGQSNMNETLKDYINENYPNSKSDLMTVFMEISIALTKKSGQIGMINLPSWMFLSSYKKFRQKLLNQTYITSLIQQGRGIFGSDFGSVSFCLEKSTSKGRKGVYRRLFVEHVKVDSIEVKEKRFLQKTFGYFIADQSNFSKIPSCPLGYWASKQIISTYNNPPLSSFATPRAGMITGNNNIFVRFFHEVSFEKIGFGFCSKEEAAESNKKYFPYQKGGPFRKWYGNLEYIVDFEDDGTKLRTTKEKNGKVPAHAFNDDYIFKPNVNWSSLTSGKFSTRITINGNLFDASGSAAFPNKLNETFVLSSFLNTPIVNLLLSITNPTLNFQAWEIGNLPVNEEIFKCEEIYSITLFCLNISKNDWNSKETSWDFNQSFLINYKSLLEESFYEWQNKITIDFYKLQGSEEELNRIFIDIYGLNEELDPIVPLKDITILQDELDRNALEETDKELRKRRQWKLEEGKWQLVVDGDLQPVPLEGELPQATVRPPLPIKKEVVMQQLISYAVGCMMGRYSLAAPGLILVNQGETMDDYYEKVRERMGEGENGRGREWERERGSEGEMWRGSDESENGREREGENGRGREWENGERRMETEERKMENGKSEEDQITSSSPVSPLKGGLRGAFLPDEDGIVPMMGSNCGFSDDSVLRLRQFIEAVWGSETLTQNINFLQSCLDMEIEKYLVNQGNFWKDHCSRYKKKPIYWLFSSKKGAFQVLVYMHRMNRFTVQRIRESYMFKHLQWLANQKGMLESRSATLSRDETRQLDNLRTALAECQEYDLQLKNIADRQIEFDLDDGVSVNYEKFAPLLAAIK